MQLGERSEAVMERGLQVSWSDRKNGKTVFVPAERWMAPHRWLGFVQERVMTVVLGRSAILSATAIITLSLGPKERRSIDDEDMYI